MEVHIYGGLFLSWLPSISNISLSRTKCSVPWSFPQEQCIAFLYFELLYLELLPLSKKFLGSLSHFLSLSRTFTYSNFISEFRNKLEFESKQKFRPSRKKNLFFVLSVVKTKMSVKRKLNTKILKEKCDILWHIEKGMKNKEAADKFGVPKNNISTWIKNKEKILKSLKKVLQALRKCVVVNTKKSTRLCLKGLFYKGARIYL